MVAAGLFGSRRGLGHVHARNQCDSIAERLQGFGDEGEVEVLAFLQRTPVTGCCAMRMPDAEEPGNRCRGSFLQFRLCRHHAVQQRQTDHYARTPQEGPAWNELLGEKHKWTPLSCLR